MTEDTLEPPPESHKLADYNAIAAFPSMDDARAAIKRLGAAGIDPRHTSLIGHAAEEANHPDQAIEREREALKDVGSHVLKGAGVGAVTGGAVAAALGAAFALAIPGIGPVVASGLMGAWVGAGIGGVTGGYTAISAAQAWELTYANIKAGNPVLAVHSDDPEQIAEALELIQSSDPVESGTFDEDGNAIDLPA